MKFIIKVYLNLSADVTPQRKEKENLIFSTYLFVNLLKVTAPHVEQS